MPKNQIQAVNYIHVTEEKTEKRQLIVFNNYRLYESSGENSKMRGVIFPYLTLHTKEEKYKPGYIVKPLLARGASEDKKNELYHRYFGEDEKLISLLKKNSDFGRFGNIEALLISYALSEQAWKAQPELKKIMDHIQLNPIYMGYVQNIKNNNFYFTAQAEIVRISKKGDSEFKETLIAYNKKAQAFYGQKVFPDYKECLENIKNKMLTVNKLKLDAFQADKFYLFSYNKGIEYKNNNYLLTNIEQGIKKGFINKKTLDQMYINFKKYSAGGHIYLLDDYFPEKNFDKNEKIILKFMRDNPNTPLLSKTDYQQLQKKYFHEQSGELKQIPSILTSLSDGKSDSKKTALIKTISGFLNEIKKEYKSSYKKQLLDISLDTFNAAEKNISALDNATLIKMLALTIGILLQEQSYQLTNKTALGKHCRELLKDPKYEVIGSIILENLELPAPREIAYRDLRKFVYSNVQDNSLAMSDLALPSFFKSSRSTQHFTEFSQELEKLKQSLLDTVKTTHSSFKKSSR